MFCHSGAHAQCSEPPPASFTITLTKSQVKLLLIFCPGPTLKLLAAFPTMSARHSAHILLQYYI